MKRIISLIMSVLMIATMFCSFAVTSTAAEDAPFHVTVVASEVSEEGTVDVEIYVKDTASYGLFNFGFYVKWDEAKLTPVTTTVSGKAAFLNAAGMVDFVNAVNGIKDNEVSLFTEIGYGSSVEALRAGIPPKVKGYFITGEDPCNWIAIKHNGNNLYPYPFTTNPDYMTAWGVEPSALGYVDGKGILMATATFKVVEGATGEAKVWAETENGNIILSKDDYVTIDPKKAEEGLSCTPAVINCTTEPAAPALPENVNTLEVQTGVSARKDTYNGNHIGLRFTTKVDVDNWTGVSEMGTAIVKKGTKPGVDTTLTVPARVDINGKYLQAHTKNEDGKYVFTPGITTADTNVTYTGVISNIKPENVDVEFEAYAYIIVDGVTYYSANSESATYNEIFNAAQNDPTIAD